MMDDSSKDDGGTAGSHLLHLISRAAPRILGAAWVVAEAAVRRVADVIQAVRGPEAPPPALPARREDARSAATERIEPLPSDEDKPAKPEPGQTATREKKRRAPRKPAKPKTKQRAPAKKTAKKRMAKPTALPSRTAKKAKRPTK